MHANRQQTVKRVIFTSLMLHIGLGFWFVERGLINGDEGWYLYAARQIANGLEPYRDFAFFQMPVYPRLLSGMIEPGPGSIITARWLSWLMLLLATCTTGLAALRMRGLAAAMIAVVCVGLNPLVIGTAVLVKPYAVAMFLSASGLLLMAATDRVRVGLGFCLFGLAVGSRLSLLLPLMILMLFHRGPRRIAAVFGSLMGLGIALYPSLGTSWTVLWENWVGYHLGNGGGVMPRLSWLGWQLGLCGFFFLGTVSAHQERIPGLRLAAWLGVIVHAVPSSLHVEHTVVMMPLMGLALADRWGEALRPRVLVIGAVLLSLSVVVGTRWMHLDRDTRTVDQTMALGRWVAERTAPTLPLLTTHLAIAVEADRSVCSGFEMGTFGWAPDMGEMEVSAFHRLDEAGLKRCMAGPLGGVIIAERDFDSVRRSNVFSAAEARFGVHRTVQVYGQFSEQLDIFVSDGGLFWTE